MSKTKLLLLPVLLFAVLIGTAQEARLLRFPAVYGNQVVFTYAGDMYSVARTGGVARKLTNDAGYEMFPRFSHDGKQIAFTAQYDGNTEVYVMPSQGGVPKRITYTATLGRDDVADRMGPNNIVMCWTPDDKNVVFRSRGTSFNSFKGKLYKAPLSADIAEELPFSVASWCTYNADGSKLAMNHVMREFRTWKYYRGGMADDVYLYDVKSGNSENITNNNAQDIFPMYYQNKVYFFSDRDRTMNLFEYDTQTKQTKKLTNFTEYDCKFPSLGNDAIAFENGGYVYVFDCKTGKADKVDITLAEDLSSGRNKQVDASKFVSSYSVSPDGKRAVIGARGDVFTIPAKEGVTRDITHSSGAHDRNVDWSPNGKWISYISDKTGEDELYVQLQDGSEEPKQLTKGGGPYKFYPVWSPDSKWLLLGDRGQDVYAVNVETSEKKMIVHSDDREISEYGWSPDSKWVAYTFPGKARGFDVIRIYNIDTKKTVQVTDEWYQSGEPAFSPDGKYLYFVSLRDFNPIYSYTEWNHAYVDMSKVYLARLSKDTKSAFETENDEVTIKDVAPDELTSPEKNPVQRTRGQKENGSNTEEKKEASTKTDTDKNDNKTEAVKVDEDGLSARIEALSIAAGNYGGLVPASNGIYYYAGSYGNPGSLKYFNLKDKKETEIGAFNRYAISYDRKKIMLRKGSDYFIEDLGTSKLEPKNKIDLSGLKINTSLHEEWKQIFEESWRQMRDYFYDPNMHGVNWKAMHDKYSVLLPYVNHRNDLTYIIGEMIGELNVGHAYVLSGDRPDVDRVPMGLLGATLSRHSSGYYKIDSILTGASWSKSLTSPLRAPGVKVKTGDFILSIDGTSTKDVANIYQLLTAKAGQTIEMMVNSSASASGAHKELIKPIADESELYYNEWVQQNIDKVTKASNGKIGYLHIPDMGVTGLNMFARYFYPQLDKEALIVDDRGNGGGNVSPMIIERLRRKPGLGTMNRNQKTASIKPDAQIGPKVCLIDQYSASDGDLFPYQFQYYELGPLIGQRTWGGVVGIRGTLPFIDGAYMSKPEFAHFAADGSKFIIEGIGVSPDIEVKNDPHEEYLGKDAQLAKAIEELKKEMAKPGQYKVPPIPAFPDKSK